MKSLRSKAHLCPNHHLGAFRVLFCFRWPSRFPVPPTHLAAQVSHHGPIVSVLNLHDHSQSPWQVALQPETTPTHSVVCDSAGVDLAKRPEIPQDQSEEP